MHGHRHLAVAAPHVAGALALLLSAFPDLSADQQEAALESGAVDLGAAGLDNDFGYGRLDVLAAYSWLAVRRTSRFAVSPSVRRPSAAGGSRVVHGHLDRHATASPATSRFGLSGLPAGSRRPGAFTPSVISGGAGTSQLVVTTAATIAPGTYPLTITATSGALTRTATATLVVSGPPDFMTSSTPASQSVVAGGSARYSVGVTALNGFTGDVSLSVVGLPASVGATFTPATITTAGSSQLALSTSTSTIPGPLSVDHLCHQRLDPRMPPRSLSWSLRLLISA